MSKPASGAPAPISNRITVINGQPTTTTHDIAEVFGKGHNDVLRIVRQRMEEAGEWGVRNFTQTPYTDPQNGQTYPVIRMTEKGFMFVVQKFTGKKAVATQIAFVDEFERMRNALQTAPAQPAIEHSTQAESVNVRFLLAGGQSDPTAPLPASIQLALDQKAFALAHEAYELCREHLARRVAFTSEVGSTRNLDKKRALDAIRQGNLGHALAHRYYTELRQVAKYAEMTRLAAESFHDNLIRALGEERGKGI